MSGNNNKSPVDFIGQTSNIKAIIIGKKKSLKLLSLNVFCLNFLNAFKKIKKIKADISKKPKIPKSCNTCR